MKNYTPLNNEITKKFILKDLYRYTALALTPSKKGYTDATFEQLAAITGDKVSAIEEFITRLKESGIINIKTIRTNSVNGTTSRNHYTFIEGKNYRMITKEILTTNVTNEAKGLLIGIILQTLNNSNLCGYSKNKIISNLRASKTTALKCFKELEDANLITITNEGVLVSLDIIVLTEAKKAKAVKVLKDITANGALSNCKVLRMANYYILHPEKIKDVTKLSLFIETGVKVAKKKNAKEILLTVA